MKNYRIKIKPYLDDLAKKGLGPGGGSTGALAFCLGSSLIIKSIRHSLNKNINKTKENKLQNRIKKLTFLKKKIYSYIDKDRELFSKTVKAQGAKRKKYLEEITVLLKDLADSSQEAFSLAKEVDFDIKNSIKSDFYLGISFIRISMESVVYNLEANRKISGKKDGDVKKIKNKLKMMEKK